MNKKNITVDDLYLQFLKEKYHFEDVLFSTILPCKYSVIVYKQGKKYFIFCENQEQKQCLQIKYKFGRDNRTEKKDKKNNRYIIAEWKILKALPVEIRNYLLENGLFAHSKTRDNRKDSTLWDLQRLVCCLKYDISEYQINEYWSITFDVHHRNTDSLHNEIENLLPMDKSTHELYHETKDFKMKKNLLIEAEKEIQKRVTKKYNTLSGNINVIKEVLSYHLQGLTLRKISEKIDNKMSANTINEKIIKVYNHKAEFLKFLDRKDIPELLGQTENKIIKIDTPKSITIQDFTPVLDFKEFALHLEKKCQI